jgi:ribose transport system permease protein
MTALAKVRRMKPVTLGADKYSGLYLLAIFIAVFGFWKPGLFLTAATLHSVASQQVIVAMIAIAVLVPLATGTYDLSVGATTNLSAIVAVWLQDTYHLNLVLAIAAAVFAALVIGVVNGFIVVRLRVSSFIATLGTASIITAVQTMAAGASQPLPPTSSSWQNLTQAKVGGFQIVVLYLVVVAIILWWLLDHTPMGRYLFAVGGNYEAARLAGVKADKWVWLSLVTSSGICGVAGVLFASQIGPSLTFGAALLLPAYAAAFLGSTQLKPGRFNVWGTLIAVYALATGVQGLQFVTGAQWLDDMFDGVALVAAVAFAVWRQRVGYARRTRTRTRDVESVPAANQDRSGSYDASTMELAPSTGAVSTNQEVIGDEH